MKETATAHRRKPGRPTAMEGGRSRRIYIDDESWAVAKKLGAGSVSEGIRRALFATKDKNNSAG